MTAIDTSLISAFEQACQDSQVASTRIPAETTLQHFSQHPQAIPLALTLIETTSSPITRFHAAATLRHATRNKWSNANFDHQSSYNIRLRLLESVLSTPQLLPFERKAILRTTAFIACRSYLDEPSQLRNDFFDHLCNAVANNIHPAAAETLDLLLDEFFSPELSSSALPIEKEILIRTRSQFSIPSVHLLNIYRAAVSSLIHLLPDDHAISNIDDKQFQAIALHCLSIIHRILSTDITHFPPPGFSHNDEDNEDNVNYSGISTDVDNGNGNSTSTNFVPNDSLEAVVISTFVTKEWVPVIEQIPIILTLCLRITASQIVNRPPDYESELLSKALHTITAISAIRQGSYMDIERGHVILGTIMAGVNDQRWCSCNIGAVRLAYAEVWRRISCAHGLPSVQRLNVDYVSRFTKDTCDEMDSAAVRLAQPDHDEDVFSMDVIDVLLETWANLALQADDGAPNSEHTLSFNIERVVFHFVRMSLRSSPETAAIIAANSGQQLQIDTEEDLGFEDSSLDDSRLSVAAILTRFVLPKVVPAISQYMLETAEKVFRWQELQQQNQQSPAIPLDVYQEDLYFLIQLTSAVLADESKGEYPSIPTQFLPFSHEQEPITEESQGPELLHAQTLLSALFQVAQKETQLINDRSGMCAEASPRVATALLDSLTRITRTYLAPMQVSTASQAFHAIGGISAAEGARNACLHKVMEGISRRGVEADIANAAARLLSTLASGANQYPQIRASPVWETLLRAGAEAYQTLPPPAVQDVGRSLTNVLGDTVAEQLLIPAYNSLQRFTQSRNITADAAERTIATVHLLKGAARCNQIGNRTKGALLVALQAPDGTAATCAKGFGQTRPEVSRSLIGLAEDVIYSCFSVLPDEQARLLITNSISLIKLHTEIVKSHMNESSVEDVGEDVEQLLSLLSYLLDEKPDDNIGEACYYGLATLLPIMSKEVLSLPSVSGEFFLFVSRLVCHHSEKLASLPSDLCGQILQTIDVQRNSTDLVSERRGLEAIASLGRSYIRGRMLNGDGRAVVESALKGFLNSIFTGVASGSAHTSNLDAAADALLPLTHMKQDGTHLVFEEVVRSFVTSSGNNPKLQATVQELVRMASEAGIACGYQEVQGSVSITNKRAAELQAAKSFREAFGKFSAEARSCLLSATIPTSANN